MSDVLGRLALLGGVACAALIGRSPWWAAGAVPLLAVGAWSTVVGFRAQRDLEADEALEAAAEYDRANPSVDPEEGDDRRSR